MRVVLAPRDVVVFVARPAALDDADHRAAALAILTDDERARLDRFRFDRDRDVALASRALQRRALSWCVETIAPSAWRFTAGPDGRPHISAPPLTPLLSWNVANTLGLVGCAVTRDGALGLDLEPRRADAPAEIVDSHFAIAERAALRALAAADQPRRFVELWTLKEAYLKARSVGLALPLDRLAFDPSTTPPGFATDPSLADDPARWQLAQWWPTADHVAAICVQRGGAPRTIVERWDG